MLRDLNNLQNVPGLGEAPHAGVTLGDVTGTPRSGNGTGNPERRGRSQAADGRAAPYSYSDLDELAKHFTEEEDAANKVERQVGKSAAAMLLESRVGEQFGALVTGASDKGTWARLLSIPVEGRVVGGFEGVEVGDQIRVQPMSVDVERGFIDFKRVDAARH